MLTKFNLNGSEYISQRIPANRTADMLHLAMNVCIYSKILFYFHNLYYHRILNQNLINEQWFKVITEKFAFYCPRADSTNAD